MSKIKVALRVRPLSKREIEGNFPVVVEVENNSAFVTDIRVPERPNADSRARIRQFDFDHGFHLQREWAREGASQAEIYAELGPRLESSALQGFNSSLLAYGQSGTGKTHTMLGSKDDPGIIPRLCHNIWSRLETSGGEFKMEVSFMELYREKVRDLLVRSQGQLKLQIREHPQLGPIVQNLSRLQIKAKSDLGDLLWEGEKRRANGVTASNPKSSRSHAIWTIYIFLETGANGNKRPINSRIHLVDLAGSEKAGFASGKNLLAEGADINRSLVALGNVISALAERAPYISYRDSTLTRLLKDSLGGNATTSIIITASPASVCHAQTLNSFRFAARARLVENKPKINFNLNLQSTSGSGHSLYSIMAANEMKKDISKLSKIIKSAQNNGGMLRGLVPQAGWNRLVSALEGWNAIEGEQLKLARGRSDSEGATSSANFKSLKEKSDAQLSTVGSKADVNVQTNIANRFTSSEVFIPSSSSIKCLSWKADEIQISTPKISPKSSYSPKELYFTPPLAPKSYLNQSQNFPRLEKKSASSASLKTKKILLPLQFSVSSYCDHSARISEKISSKIPPLPYPIPSPQLEIVSSLFDSEGSGLNPLIRQRIPTLVNSQAIEPNSEVARKLPSESTVELNVLELEQQPNELPTEEIAATAAKVFEQVFEDFENEFEPEVREVGKSFKLHLPPIVRLLNGRSKAFEDISEEGSEVSNQKSEDFEERSEAFSSQEVISTPIWSEVSSSNSESSSSWNFKPVKIQIVPQLEEITAKMETVSDWVNEQTMGKVPVLLASEAEEISASDSETSESEVSGSSSLNSNSKFRSHFSRELSQMDRIGAQLKELQKMSDRVSRLSLVKPYLSQISSLSTLDHFTPDPELDHQIEACSGWNIETELRIVNKEMQGLNKLLRDGARRDSTSVSSEMTRGHGNFQGRRPNSTAECTRGASNRGQKMTRGALSESAIGHTQDFRRQIGQIHGDYNGVGQEQRFSSYTPRSVPIPEDYHYEGLHRLEFEFGSNYLPSRDSPLRSRSNSVASNKSSTTALELCSCNGISSPHLMSSHSSFHSLTPPSKVNYNFKPHCSSSSSSSSGTSGKYSSSGIYGRNSQTNL